MQSADATSAVEEARAARARGDVKQAVELLHGAIEPLAASGNSDALREIVDEAESIAASSQFRRPADYVARRARSHIRLAEPSAASGSPTDYDAIPARPSETVLNESLSDLMPELQRAADRGMRRVRVFGVSVFAIVIATAVTTVRYGLTAFVLGIAGLGVFIVAVAAICAFNMLLNMFSYRTWTYTTYVKKAMLIRLAEDRQEGKLTDEEFFAVKRKLGF